jgi:hypothetical protein
LNEWLAIVIHQLGQLGALKMDTFCLNENIVGGDLKPENERNASMIEDYYSFVIRLLLLKANKLSSD